MDVAPPIRLLVFSTLYPNAAAPRHGIFVENRLRHLLSSGSVSARVVAPVPWFPFRRGPFGAYRRYAAAPKAETRHGIDITHPRYLVVPKIGMSLAPDTLYRATKHHVAALRRQGTDFDIIDAHYFYPDGVAAIRLGALFGKPVTITGRGTDLNLIPDHPGPRRAIQWAARHSAHNITVSAALRDVLTETLGVPDDRVTVLRNGVDTTQFAPRDRAACRAKLAVNGRVILSVGHLIERKGHHLVIDALTRLRDVTLLIAGEGPEESALQARAQSRGVAERVRLLGAVPHHELPAIYTAADALVLASSREGWANVLLEAMACGTPVAATGVWGAPELITCAEAGLLIPERTPAAIAEGVGRLLAAPPQRAATRAFAELFSWDATTNGQLAIFRRLMADRCVPAGSE